MTFVYVCVCMYVCVCVSMRMRLLCTYTALHIISAMCPHARMGVGACVHMSVYVSGT